MNVLLKIECLLSYREYLARGVTMCHVARISYLKPSGHFASVLTLRINTNTYKLSLFL